MKPSEKLKVYSPVEGVDGNIIAFDIHATLMKVLDYLDEQASKEESIVGRLDNAGLYRQLFAEMDKGKTFTAEELYNLFESYAPLDPKGLLKKAFEAQEKCTSGGLHQLNTEGGCYNCGWKDNSATQSQEKHTHVRHWDDETKQWKCPCEEVESPQSQEKECCENCNGSKNQSSSISSVCSGNCPCHKKKECCDGCRCKNIPAHVIVEDGFPYHCHSPKCNCHKEPVSERNEEEWENPNFHKNACDHRATPLNYICDCPCHSERNALIDELIEDIDFAMSKTRKANVPINLYDYVIELLKSKKK